MKRVLAGLVSLLLITQAYAVEPSIPAEVAVYAEQECRGLLGVASINEGIDYSDAYLGTPIIVPSLQGSSAFIYYFPVVCAGTITGIMSVVDNSGYMSISYSQSFADELMALVERGSEFSVSVSMNGLVAETEESSVLLEGPYSNNFSSIEWSTLQRICASELLEPVSTVSVPSPLYDPDEHLEYGKLDIAPVPQIGENRCWAACCAMIINYKKGTDLTAVKVSYAVKGTREDVAGSWEDMKKAYNMWYLYPGVTPGDTRISYITLVNKITNDDPLHLGLTVLDTSIKAEGHSVVACGYARKRDGKYLIIIDPLDADVHYVKYVDPPAPMYYVFDGIVMEWTQTRMGFWTPPDEVGLLPDIEFPWEE